MEALTDAETCAIQVCDKIIQKLSHYHEMDIKTFRLIEHILSEEINKKKPSRT